MGNHRDKTFEEASGTANPPVPRGLEASGTGQDSPDQGNEMGIRGMSSRLRVTMVARKDESALVVQGPPAGGPEN